AALPHSLVIINPVTPLPIEDGVPAFPRALTVRLVAGLLAGETDSFEFVANKEGRFLFLCGVTGHGVADVGLPDRVEGGEASECPGHGQEERCGQCPGDEEPLRVRRSRV